MESNLNNINIEIKQEVVGMPDENEQHFINSSIDIKTETDDTHSEFNDELYESNSLKVITDFCQNIQNQIGKTKETDATSCKGTAQKNVKRQAEKKQKHRNAKQEFEKVKCDDNTQASKAKRLPVKQNAVLILLKENPNLNANKIDKSANVKEELEDTNQTAMNDFNLQALIKSDSEDSVNLLERLNHRKRKRKSNNVTVKEENLQQPEGIIEDLTGKVRKNKGKPKINKINKSEEKSGNIKKITKPSTPKKKNSQKRQKAKILEVIDKNSNSDGNEINQTDKKSDGLQEVGRKKRKRKSKRKPQPTEEEKAEKERQKLERRTCTICSAVFALPDGLRNHIRSKHTFEKPYSCKFCGQQFSTRSSHSLHRRRYHGVHPYLCNVCGKTFLQKASLEVHIQIHTPSQDKIRDVKCDFCSNTYTSKLNLQKHVLTKHTDPSEWKHECNVCGKKCFSTTDLTLHMRRHNDDRKHKCSICGRGFFTKQTMNVHFRTHSATTAFNCEHCSSGYRSNEALQHHMLKVHGIGEEKPVSLPTHFCPVCSEGFRQRARLEKHLIIHETGEEEYPFKCEKCDKQYKARNYFTIHMLDKHKEFIDDDYFKTRFELGNLEHYSASSEGVDN